MSVFDEELTCSAGLITMRNKWQQFLFSVLAQLIMPLMPMLIEWGLTGAVEQKTLALTAAMYGASIAVVTQNLALLGASILVAVMFSAVFGFLAAGTGQAHFSVSVSSIIVIASFMTLHGMERYKRHIRDGELFLVFGDSRVSREAKT